MMPDRFTAFESTRASITFGHAHFEVAVVVVVSAVISFVVDVEWLFVAFVAESYISTVWHCRWHRWDIVLCNTSA
jgi:hypothetical protein